MRAVALVAAALGSSPGPRVDESFSAPSLHAYAERAAPVHGPVRRWRRERVARPGGFKRITQGGRVCYRKRVRIDGRKVAVTVRRAS